MSTVPRSAFVFAALLAASIAAGCSSGGSNSAPTPAGPTPLPPLVFPSTTPGPQTTSFFPVPVPTATFFFKYGGLTEAAAIGPTPNPSPSQTSLSIADVDLFGGRAVFPGFSANGFTIGPVSNVYDDNITEAVTGSSSFTTLIDNYYALSNAPSQPSGSQIVTLVGSVEKTPFGSSTQATFVTGYGANNGVIDVIPEPSNQSQNQNPITIFNNTSAMQTAELDSDGQTTTRTVNADGSYTENVGFGSDGFSAQAVENSDGSGTYSYTNPDPSNPGQVNVSIGAPASGTIPITFTLPGGSPQQTSIPDWYPGGGAPVLYGQTFLNFGPSPIPNPANAFGLNPPDCGFQQGLTEIQGPDGEQIPANLISQTTNRVDTVFGEIETATLQSYRAPGFPNVCEFDGDNVVSYYDYSEVTPVFQSSPLGTTTFGKVLSIVQETFNLDGQSRYRRGLKGSQRAPLHGASRQRAQGQQGMPAILNTYGFHGTAFARIERLRIQRHAQIWRRLHQLYLRRHHR